MPASAPRNLLEPPAFAELFRRFPPVSFICGNEAALPPLFYTDFDLLTTLEPDLLARLRALPLFRLWSRLLRFKTCFIGSTITEYAPMPGDAAPEALIHTLAAQVADGQALTIIKDLPQASPLLSPQDNAFADALALAAAQNGFIPVQGQALAYVPIDFSCIDEYLSRLSSGRRKNLRRKLKKRGDFELELLPLGDPRFADQALLDEWYSMYLAVFEQSEIHFDLLSPNYFAALLQSREIEGFAFCYRHASGLAGYNICLIHEGRLIDKYIGFKYPLARELNLYFISWLINLEFALDHGLHTYIAGWTDPEVKAGLGASFTFTRHLVRVRNPVLRRLLFSLRHCFESDGQALAAKAQARQDGEA